MKIFLVGGAVRDFLLAKLKSSFHSLQDEQAYWQRIEKDWVVVGSTPQEMLSLGYRPVGKSFPVFLHPDSQEEYALARTEKKIGKGYKGFECFADPEVTLEEDLKRRDLTINAMAFPLPTDWRALSLDTLIDPYHGLEDLKNKFFRHVSEAFAEDPVRILRVARLACKFGDFKVHPTTLALMTQMVLAGEVDALIAERVWQEWSRSLSEQSPWRWFEILHTCQAQAKLFPSMDQYDIKKKALMLAVSENASDQVRLAIQLFDVTEQALTAFLNQYRIPNDFRELALMVAQYSSCYFDLTWQPAQTLDLFEKTDAFRRPQRFLEFVTTCDLLARAYNKQMPHAARKLQGVLQEVVSIDSKELLAKGLKGKQIADEIRRIRLERITTLLL